MGKTLFSHNRPRPRPSSSFSTVLLAGVAAAVLLGQFGCARGLRQPPEQMLSTAKRAYDRKSYGTARRLAARIVERAPASPVAEDAWLVVIDSYMAQRNWPRAFDECEKMLERHPQTKHHGALLRREFQIGEALAASHVWFLFFRLPRLEEGIKVLSRVIEHAPFGPLADRALYAIGEARFRDQDYKAAVEAYDRLLKQYPNSDLIIRARVRRATANQRLAEGPAYDSVPAVAARRDMEDLARMSGNERVSRYARELRDMTARGDYDSGIFYFGRYSIEGGVRYMKAVLARYPDTDYADRAERILALVKRLTDEATGEGEPR